MRSENNQNIEKYYNGIISNNNNANQFSQSEFNQNIPNSPYSESVQSSSFKQNPSCNSYQENNSNDHDSQNIDQISMIESDGQACPYDEQTQRKYYGTNQNFYPPSIVVPRNTLIGLDCTQYCPTQYFSQVPNAYNQGADIGNASTVYFPQQQNSHYFSTSSIDNGPINQTYLTPRLKNSTGCIIQTNPPTVYSPSAYPSQPQTNQNLQTLFTNNKRNTQNETDLYAGMQNLCLDSNTGAATGSHSNQNHFSENGSVVYQTQSDKASRMYAYNPHQSPSPNQYSAYYQNQPAFYPQQTASPHQAASFPHQIGFWNNGNHHNYFDYANPQQQQRVMGFTNFSRITPVNSNNHNSNTLRNQKLTIPLSIRNNPDINPKELDMSLLRNSRYFVIKSGCAYNVEKAMYHGIWCSTSYGNDTLDTAYCETHRIEKKSSKKDPLSQQERNDLTEKNKDGQTSNVKAECADKSQDASDISTSLDGSVLLFFSITHSRSICGVAEMVGRNDKNASSSIWSESRWKGQFPIKWIYVKQVPDTIMNHIQLPRNENKPITRVRDCTEIWPSSLAEELLQIIHKYPNQ